MGRGGRRRANSDRVASGLADAWAPTGEEWSADPAGARKGDYQHVGQIGVPTASQRAGLLRAMRFIDLKPDAFDEIGAVGLEERPGRERGPAAGAQPGSGRSARPSHYRPWARATPGCRAPAALPGQGLGVPLLPLAHCVLPAGSAL